MGKEFKQWLYGAGSPVIKINRDERETEFFLELFTLVILFIPVIYPTTKELKERRENGQQVFIFGRSLALQISRRSPEAFQ
jgi:hypothetical protein